MAQDNYVLDRDFALVEGHSAATFGTAKGGISLQNLNSACCCLKQRTSMLDCGLAAMAKGRWLTQQLYT